MAGLLWGVLGQAHHLSFTAGGQSVGVDRKHLALKVSEGSADLAQSDLQGDGIVHGAGVEQLVDSDVGDHKGQAVGHFKALLREGALMPHAVDSQSRFVDQLQSQAGRQLGMRTSAETPQKVPQAQTKVFGDKEPKTDQIARDLIAKQLSDPTLQVLLCTAFFTHEPFGSMRFDLNGSAAGSTSMEFFFEARTGRSLF